MNVFNFGSGVERHYECRECGTNLDADADECPDCGGEPVEFSIS